MTCSLCGGGAGRSLATSTPPVCRKCYRSTRPDAYKEHNKTQYRRDVITHRINSAKRRARIKGIPFTITRADVVIPENCPICARALAIGRWESRASAPSLDQLVPDGGYTPENTWVICWRCNDAKRNATPDLMVRVLAELASRGLYPRAA